ncbi:MAG: hypothetical protein CMB78_06250 [Euryarchaeota archaeon]|nr:hypothetical protein [Euryarchaeota archaeon]|tara:strand:+ start:954 stop:1373 length:420 start_codon:yes stop_codon:yes gene_type:complete
MTIIDWINQVLVHKKSWDSFDESEQKTFSPYILNRFLSMDKEFIEVVNYFQRYSIGFLENREIYNFYCHLLPKGKRFNKYIKAKKEKKYKEWLIDIVRNHYEISKKDTIECLSLISKEDLILLLEKYGVEDKKIREVTK